MASAHCLPSGQGAVQVVPRVWAAAEAPTAMHAVSAENIRASRFMVPLPSVRDVRAFCAGTLREIMYIPKRSGIPGSLSRVYRLAEAAFASNHANVSASPSRSVDLGRNPSPHSLLTS